MYFDIDASLYRRNVDINVSTAISGCVNIDDSSISMFKTYTDIEVLSFDIEDALILNNSISTFQLILPGQARVTVNAVTGTHSVVLHVLICVQAVEDVTSERVEEPVVVILHEQGPIVVGNSVGCSLSSVVKHAACNMIKFQRMKEHERTCKQKVSLDGAGVP